MYFYFWQDSCRLKIKGYQYLFFLQIFFDVTSVYYVFRIVSAFVIVFIQVNRFFYNCKMESTNMLPSEVCAKTGRSANENICPGLYLNTLLLYDLNFFVLFA